MSMMSNSYINSMLANLYGNNNQYGGNQQYGNQHYGGQYGQQHGGYGHGGGQYGSLMTLIQLLLERRNGGGEYHPNPTPSPGHQSNRAEGDGTLSGDDRRFEWKGADGNENDYMKFRDLDDSMVKVKTKDGHDVIDIDSSVSDTEIRVYDFTGVDQLRLEGDGDDWAYEVDPSDSGDGGTVTFINDFTDTKIRLKLDDLSALGTYNATDNNYDSFDESILFF